MTQLILIAHNLRSAHNIGSLLRTADGLGVEQVLLTGYTPYPRTDPDPRMPHIADKVSRQISKTALGAEKSVNWQHIDDIGSLIGDLRTQGYVIAGLEQQPDAINLVTYKSPKKIVIIVGREVEGLESEIINSCDLTIEIPMVGSKESYNVVQAAAIAIYHIQYVE
ncbi:MAG: RNA methyltransferase [Candidatus Saccharimonadales bacterium]